MHFITRTAAAAAFCGALIAASGGILIADWALMAGAAPAAFAAPGPKAPAGQLGRVTVQPDPAAPGEPVRVMDKGRCAGGTTVANSMAFSAPAALRPTRDRQLAGSARIRGGAHGTYPVIVTCGKKEISGSVSVAKKPGTAKRARVVRKLGAHGRAPGTVLPKGPAATGDGTTSRGYDAAMVEAGLAIAGLGTAAGLAARLRRSKSRT